jgi:hypothetical protein
MGKSTISMVIFNSYVKLPEGKCWGKQTHFIFREVFAEVQGGFTALETKD